MFFKWVESTLWICLYPFCNFTSLVLKILFPHQLHSSPCQNLLWKKLRPPLRSLFLCYPTKTNMTGWNIHHEWSEWRCISCWTWGFSSQSCSFAGVNQGSNRVRAVGRWIILRMWLELVDPWSMALFLSGKHGRCCVIAVFDMLISVTLR